jgi:glucosamine--fructose-6-phosphate aminotransferase (isomerizing)
VVAHLVSEQVEAGLIACRRSRRCCRSCAAPSRSPSLFRQHPRPADRRAARLAAGRRLWRRRNLSRLGRAGAGAADPQKIAYLDEGDWVIVTREGAQIFRQGQRPVERAITTSGVSAAAIEKGNYRHFMQKEIFEQPTVVAQTLRSYIRQVEQTVALPQMDFDLSKSTASPSSPAAPATMPGWSPNTGSSSSRACPVDIDVASEFRYRDPVLEAGRAGAVHLAIGRDRRHAGRAAPLQGKVGQTIAVVVNVPTSSMAREADLLLPTHAGPEIGVASTKAFTCQLAVLAALAAHLAVKRKRIGPGRGTRAWSAPDRSARLPQRRAGP